MKVFCGELDGLAGNPTHECLYIDEDGRLFTATLVVYRGHEGQGIGVAPVSMAEAVIMLAEQGEVYDLEPLNAKEAREWLGMYEAPEEAYRAANLL